MPKIGGNESILNGECMTMDMFHRRARRSSRPKAIIQSFKMVVDHAPASRAATTVHNFTISTGQDSLAAGQGSPINTNVPTGAIIPFFEIQWSTVNLVSVSAYFWVTIQRLHSGQSAISGRVVGGDPQRNQVHRQLQYIVGKDQNSNHVWKFSVPPKYRRVREGDIWMFTIESDVVHNSAVQIIYKHQR